jgi:hypothetical protein
MKIKNKWNIIEIENNSGNLSEKNMEKCNW